MDKETYRQLDRIEAMLTQIHKKTCPEDYKEEKIEGKDTPPE